MTPGPPGPCPWYPIPSSGLSHVIYSIPPAHPHLPIPLHIQTRIPNPTTQLPSAIAKTGTVLQSPLNPLFHKHHSSTAAITLALYS